MRIGSGLALATAALLLVGCGNSTPGGGSSGGGGGGGGDLTVAVIIPLTGASAQLAGQMENAAELAAAEVNADGGVDGRKIVLKVYDDKLTPEAATQQAQRAVTRDRAVAVIGGQTSGEALAIREVVERAKVPFITTSATSEAVTADATYTFRIAPLLTDYANGVVDVAKALGLEDPAVLNDSGPAGLLLKGLFQTHAGEVGLQFAGDPIEYPINGTDVSAQVASAKGEQPDGVLIGGSAGSDHGLVAKTMLEQGLSVPLIGFSPILTADAIKIAGDAYSELPGVYSLQNLDQTKPQATAFMDAYHEEYGDAELTEQTAQTYDGIKVLAQALTASKGQGGQDLVDALNGVSGYDGASGRTGSQISFSATEHDGFQGKYLVVYKMNGSKAEQADLQL